MQTLLKKKRKNLCSTNIYLKEGVQNFLNLTNLKLLIGLSYHASVKSTMGLYQFVEFINKMERKVEKKEGRNKIRSVNDHTTNVKIWMRIQNEPSLLLV